MTMFATATDADKSSNNLILFVRLLVAAMLGIVALAQLFQFEDFPAVLAGYSLPGGESMATLLAALIVTVEVFAVPYLLMMRLSPLMRLVSFLCGWVSCILWFVLGIMFLAQKSYTTNSGLLGDTIPVTSGSSLILFATLLLAGLIIARPVQMSKMFEIR